MTVRVWDLPTRLFHWGLAACFAVAMLSGEEPSHGNLHVAAGWAAAVLLSFRVAWGFVGERWSRWSSFGQAPSHTAKASVSVIAALVAVLALVATGALVLGGEELRGPLAGWITVERAVLVHTAHWAVAWALVAWLAVHLTGIALESRKSGENLVRGMLDGRKRHAGSPVRARAGAAALLAGSVAAVIALSVGTARDSVGPALARDATWDEACGECHLAYAPSLLPAESWRQMLATDEHFGESLGLDPATVQGLTAFATANAAEAGQSESAARIAAEGFAGQRITETALWKNVHGELTDEVFARESVGSRIRCDACHPDAEDGTFDGRAVDVPAAETARLMGRNP